MRVSKSSALILPELTGAITGAFFEVYNELGYGFLEEIYARALGIVLRDKGLTVHREYPIRIRFRGQQIGFHRCDMLVARQVIVEIKATEVLASGAKNQLRNYLTAMNRDVGLLLHFSPTKQSITEFSGDAGRNAQRTNPDDPDDPDQAVPAACATEPGPRACETN